MHRIRAICFDLDNTLWDVWPVIVRAEQEMYAFLAEHFPRVTAKYSVEALRAERARLAEEQPHMGHDFSYLRLQSVQRCAQSVGYTDDVGQRAFEVFLRARNQVTLYRDVLPALDELRKRYRLMTLSNGNADLRAIGIDHYFDGRFAAREVGALKPDPRAFHHVLERTNLKAHEVVYVGDDPEADVQGARNVGMHIIWVNRDGAQWSGSSLPPPTVTRLDEVLPLIRDAAARSRGAIK